MVIAVCAQQSSVGWLWHSYSRFSEQEAAMRLNKGTVNSLGRQGGAEGGRSLTSLHMHFGRQIKVFVSTLGKMI